MTYQEKKNIVNIISSLLITLTYAWVVYQRHLSGHINLAEDYSSWGLIFIIFIVVSVVARIIIYINFHIINTIATRDEDIPVTDERDKLIALKGSRNAYITFMGGFTTAIFLLTFGLTPVFLIIAFFACGLLADVVDNFSQMYYYRKGI